MIYFTSDTHFGHANIIRYCKRPFSSVDEMDREIIRRWNEIVKPGDVVYHLGDFAVGGGPAEQYLDQLNGEIVLVVGNHENRALRCRNRFREVASLLEIEIGAYITRGLGMTKQDATLCHYAMKVWHKSHHGAWQLYGHSHGTLPDPTDSLQLDVGVDCWDFRPITAAQIEARMAQKSWTRVDHHNPTTT